MSEERKKERLQNVETRKQKRAERQERWANNETLQQGMNALGAIGNMAQSLKPEPLNKADATAQQLQNGVSSVAKSFPPIGTAIGVAMDIMNAIPGSAVNGSTMAGGAANVGNTIASLIPGLGFFASKMRDFELDEKLKNSSGYGGTSSLAQEAASHAGGKFLFGVGTIRDKMNQAELQQMKAVNNLDKAELANIASQQQVNSLRSQNMLGGGFSPNSFVVGKKGAKLLKPEVVFAKELLKKRTNPYKLFVQTLPPNLRESSDYNMKRYWELNGKPITFSQGVKQGMFAVDPTDGFFHANSVAFNKDTGEYEFMKGPKHPTIKYEIDWFKSMDPEAAEFRKYYDLDISGDVYKYIPKKQVVESLDLLEDAFDEVPSYKLGGNFNVIPDGALHKNKHNLDKIDDKFKDVTTKGIPVISEENGEITQHAEIEKEEIIFNLEVTTKLEELASIGTDEAAIEAGKLLVKEILHNTKDLTKKLL